VPWHWNGWVKPWCWTATLWISHQELRPCTCVGNFSLWWWETEFIYQKNRVKIKLVLQGGHGERYPQMTPVPKLLYDALSLVNINNLSTLCPKKRSHLMFDNNFGKCEPSIKILSLADSRENSLCNTQRFRPHLRYVATLPCKSWKSKNVADFDSILNKLLACS